MPKESSLYKQVQAFHSKAEELLKLKAATEAYGHLDSLKYDKVNLERDVNNCAESIAAYKYDINKLDKGHPGYKSKLRVVQDNLASVQVSKDNYKRRLEDKNLALIREEKDVRQLIAQIEAGERLHPSPSSKGQMIKELLNKMTYGI